MLPPSSNPGEGAEFRTNTGDNSTPQDPATPPDQDLNDEELQLHQLFAELFAELHQRAKWSMAQAGPAHTLQATALIGEAFVRLQKTDNAGWESKEHFLMTAAKVMRSILLDHHRKKRAAKRDMKRVDLAIQELSQDFQDRGIDLENLELAMERLELEQPIMAQAIQLRFYTGAEIPEIATILDIPLRTLERRMQTVKAWLRAQL